MNNINTLIKTTSIISLILFYFLLTNCSKQTVLFQNNELQVISEKYLQLNDNFDKELASFWKPGNFGSGRYKAGTVIITQNCHLPNQSCAQLTLNQGNINGDGGDGHETERTELDSGKYPFLNSQVEYSYSIFIPKNFPIVNTRLVISQIKQKGLHNGPIFAQRFRNGIHYATIRNLGIDVDKQIKFPLPDLVKGQWHNFKIIVDFSNDSTGSIRFFMNGKQSINFKGKTAYLVGENRFYHKLGLYRDKMNSSLNISQD